MASAFELNTLVEIAILNVAVSRILTHLAKATPDPNSFLSAELASGTRKPCQDDLLECFAQEKKILEIAKGRYSEIIGDIRVD